MDEEKGGVFLVSPKVPIMRAIRWNGENFEEIRETFSPYCIRIDGEGKLLVKSGGKIKVAAVGDFVVESKKEVPMHNEILNCLVYDLVSELEFNDKFSRLQKRWGVRDPKNMKWILDACGMVVSSWSYVPCYPFVKEETADIYAGAWGGMDKFSITIFDWERA